MDIKKAVRWVLFWMALALIFDTGIYFILGKKSALEFFGGYVLEWSLSLDNLFVFLMVFSFYKIHPKHQRRVLNYGILGAIVLRFLFIIVGIAVVSKFSWILYVFGIILIYSGLKMFLPEEEQEYHESKLVGIAERVLPFTSNFYGDKFFVRINNKLHATPLLIILLIIEFSDILFAIDSIPAIFSVTTNPFLVFSSNMFAILGLRSLYFVVERLHESFRFVKYGVGLILAFTGIKLGILYFNIEIPLLISIAVIFCIIALSILLSIVIPKPVEKTSK